MIRTMTTAEVGVNEFKNGTTNRFLLSAPQPNPFTTNLKLRFSIPRSGRIAIKAYDITGRVVATVIDETLDPGPHEIIWQRIDDNQCKVSSGIYFLRATYENQNITRKVIVVAD
jgi:hypothetical protein